MYVEILKYYLNKKGINYCNIEEDEKKRARDDYGTCSKGREVYKVYTSDSNYKTYTVMDSTEEGYSTVVKIYLQYSMVYETVIHNYF